MALRTVVAFLSLLMALVAAVEIRVLKDATVALGGKKIGIAEENIFETLHLVKKHDEDVDSGPVPVMCSTLDFANETFNALVFTDIEKNTKTLGRLLVGGDAHLKACSIGSGLPPSDTNDVLIVRGKLKFESGTVEHGNMVWSGQGYFSNSVLQELGQGSRVIKNRDRFDFENAEEHYLRISDMLANQEPTGETIWSPEQKTLVLSGSESNDQEIFNVTCDDLSQATDVTFLGIAKARSVIVNVNGNHCSIHDGLEFETENIKSILWNFRGVYQLYIANVALRGSILAPSTHITTSGGDIYGQIVCRKWTGPCVQHNIPFNTCVFGDAENEFALLTDYAAMHVMNDDMSETE